MSSALQRYRKVQISIVLHERTALGLLAFGCCTGTSIELRLEASERGAFGWGGSFSSLPAFNKAAMG